MKILAIGDFHGKFPEKLKKLAKNADLVLSTGDFGGSDKLLKLIFKYFYSDWAEEVGKKRARKLILEDYGKGKKIIKEAGKLNVPIFTIHGNWDFEQSSRKKQRFGRLKLKNYSKLMKPMKNIIFLKQKLASINGLNVYAFGGYLTPFIYTTREGGFNDKKRNKYSKLEKSEREKIFKLKSKNIDIFLAHYTPYCYFDAVKYKGKNPMKGKHVGIKAYADYIRKYQPRVFICGHMHEYQGTKKLGKTLIVATGAAHDGKAAIIDYPEDKKSKIKVRFIR